MFEFSKTKKEFSKIKFQKIKTKTYSLRKEDSLEYCEEMKKRSGVLGPHSVLFIE